MADTNIFFSALLFPESRPAKVLFHIVEHPVTMTVAEFLEEYGNN